ncbi:hypothetical protein Pan216_53400 [Planctomycetes bacterium Pan216]|uniref:BON domain protein n=1 Tax=Kolteria novifilia TaxID=2527975 RepID=A0A518BBT8_9BACT|nr:hypothetical protein Pan216_53400 [Planctomycetes bacterium Pan216]
MNSSGNSATLTPDHASIATSVTQKIGRRLREFCLEEVGKTLVLRGKAASYHIKQLAQHEVMAMTSEWHIANRIEVTSVAAQSLWKHGSDR